jgi:hypothetical protein
VGMEKEEEIPPAWWSAGGEKPKRQRQDGAI